MGEWLNGRKIIQAWNVIVGNDIYSVPWTPYHGLSTIIGWSSYVTKEIWYKKVGKTVFVQFYIDGVSDHTTASFTLPYPMRSDLHMGKALRFRDNGTWGIGNMLLAVGTSLLRFRATMNSTNTSFTASGNKSVIGQFRYETA